MTANPTEPACPDCKAPRANLCWVEHGGYLIRPHMHGTIPDRPCCGNAFHLADEPKPEQSRFERTVFVCDNCGGFGHNNLSIHLLSTCDPTEVREVEVIEAQAAQAEIEGLRERFASLEESYERMKAARSDALRQRDEARNELRQAPANSEVCWKAESALREALSRLYTPSDEAG